MMRRAKKLMKMTEHQLDAYLLSFIEMRYENAKHPLIYFKSKDIFEYHRTPNTPRPIEYVKADLSNMGSYMKGLCDGNYKGIYTITTYLHKKRGADVYQCIQKGD